MDNSYDSSSSLSFVSSHLSHGSSNHNVSSTTSNEHGENIEILSLNKLSGSLEKLLIEVEYDYSDAEILIEDIPVGIHRCILASRSPFFHELFKKGTDGSGKEGKPRYLMSDLMPYGTVGYQAFQVFLYYLYTGRLKASPTEETTCVDETCIHVACRPAINHALELMYASATFQMKELVLLFQALVEDVIPILMAAFNCQLDQLLSRCIQRVARSDFDNTSLEKELPHEVLTEIKSLRLSFQPESTPNAMEAESLNEKSIRRIHKALDSDDVELLKLLLNESSVTLDDAYALHYACAYSDSKVIQEVLSLGMADILRRNSRGYTVLHVAARRKDPSILVALLNKGARASDTTPDGQTALAICQRLTRCKDYHEKTVQCKESNKDRLCVDVLEREMRRNSMTVNMSVSSQLTADDLHMRLDYLEDRVAFARLLFPAEARVAIENAEADSSSLYANSSALKVTNGNPKEVDLNESPSARTRKLQLRLHALMKTVENGRRFFPHCSEVLDKFLEDDEMPDVFFLEKGSEEEQRIKKARFMELKDDVQKAFHKDMAENNHSGFSSTVSSSSSSTRREGLNHRVRRK
ncbi:BTB/POZ domain and ankyrin repeat-containing protein NPR1 isoform X2 [Glycine max]|uniref:BTB/POZ domain and ankyrin repeat-containing protein NPR1 isoform X2 n=1 Tax=Glycine max TaxID=3847 RepID=UPI0007193E36|nr:BTB/POZ domain and ankyrin repeat-containing protein NPR1 isoform X2 [Glycine max]|eukprot:XP_014622709.1 regulatory protein NPR3 isoform X2 [Glycine max]